MCFPVDMKVKKTSTGRKKWSIRFFVKKKSTRVVSINLTQNSTTETERKHTTIHNTRDLHNPKFSENSKPYSGIFSLRIRILKNFCEFSWMWAKLCTTKRNTTSDFEWGGVSGPPVLFVVAKFVAKRKPRQYTAISTFLKFLKSRSY